MEQDSRNSILTDINKIENKLKELEKEKENIQDSCSHKDWMINFDDGRSIKRW